MKTRTPPHAPMPFQPVITDSGGILRFKSNSIVTHLLEKGGITHQDLALLPFSTEDREQFAQLIGFSVAGFCELSYTSPESSAAANAILDQAEANEAANTVEPDVIETDSIEVCLDVCSKATLAAIWTDLTHYIAQHQYESSAERWGDMDMISQDADIVLHWLADEHFAGSVSKALIFASQTQTQNQA